MAIWTEMVDILVGALMVLTQAFGGNAAWAIVAVSLTARLLFLPFTYAMARRGREAQKKLAELKPQIEAINKRFATDFRARAEATQKLYSKNNVRLFDSRAIPGMLLQAPVFGSIFVALRRFLASGVSGRFLWIADLTRADVTLAALVSGLTLLIGTLNPAASEQSRLLILVPAAATFLLLLRFSAGYGIYWAASTVVGGLQALLLRRHDLEPQSKQALKPR